MSRRSSRISGRKRSVTNDGIDIGSYPFITGKYKWVKGPGPEEPFPENMVFGGKLETGQLSYIGRANVEDQTPSGFVLKETRQIHVPYGCREHRLRKFDLLIIDDQNILEWKECENGRPPTSTGCVPLNVGGNPIETIQIGRTCTPLTEGHTWEWGSQLVLSRFAMNNEDVHRPGKIHPSHNCLYVPYEGREYIFRKHEMLMLKTSPGPLKSICRWSVLKYLESKNIKSNQTIDSLPLPNAMKTFLKQSHSRH